MHPPCIFKVPALDQATLLVDRCVVDVAIDDR